MDFKIENSKLYPLIQQLELLPHNKYWQIPRPGAEYLANTVARLSPKLILEVGTSSGYSSLWLVAPLLALTPEDPATTSASTSSQSAPDTTIAEIPSLITIESNQSRFDFANQNFQKAGVQHLIQPVLGHAPEIFSSINFPCPIDLAFFDGTKSQTIQFFTQLLPYLSKNAVVLVDNVLSHQEKMQPFLKFLSQNHYKFEILNIGAGICRIIKE